MRASELPYGDQRRLELVRALATRPRLLMLDEPAAGMDTTATRGTVAAHRPDPPSLPARRHRRRARHGSDHESLRAHPGARARRAHIRGHAGRGAGQSARAGGLSWPGLRPSRRSLRRRRASRCSRSRISRVNYGAVSAIRGVSLTVAPGEVVALLGANGAGKSTTLRTISGLIRPRAGSIIFAGERIDRLPPSRIVRIGVAHCPEGRRVFGSLTVAENLRLGAAARTDPAGVAEDRERIYDLFPILRERMHQSAGTLSGGEQQMLALGPRADGQAETAAPRRAVAGSGADRGAVDLPHARRAEGRRASPCCWSSRASSLALDLADRAYVLRTGEVSLSRLRGGAPRRLRKGRGRLSRSARA